MLLLKKVDFTRLFEIMKFGLENQQIDNDHDDYTENLSHLLKFENSIINLYNDG